MRSASTCSSSSRTRTPVAFSILVILFVQRADAWQVVLESPSPAASLGVREHARREHRQHATDQLGHQVGAALDPWQDEHPACGLLQVREDDPGDRITVLALRQRHPSFRGRRVWWLGHAPEAAGIEVLRESLVSGLDSDTSHSAADVIELRVGEESAHDLRAAPEPFKGRNGDGLQIIPGHRNSPRYLVVLDILVHPFIGVQLR